MTWQQIPFIRLLIPFLLGIGLYSWFGTLDLSWTMLMGFYGVLFSAAILLHFKPNPGLSIIRTWGILLSVLLIHLGYLVSYVHDARNSPIHLQQQSNQEKRTYIASIDSPIKINAKSIKATVKVSGQKNKNTSLQACEGKAVIYFQLDTNSTRLQYGDLIIFQAALKQFAPPLNPKAFDSRSYYATQNIYHQSYLPADQWKKVGRGQGSPLYQFIYKTRSRLLQILAEHLSTPNEYAVAAALLLGAKDQLNKDLRNAYADTGAMHVLAVSGLHIGILVGLLSFLLRFVRRSDKNWLRIKTVILLSLMWSFALLTGASASVLRACTMFSFVIIGQLLNRKINIYNSLAASAFLLLCLNPLLLFQVGFQLSYFALVGIIYLHPRIYKRWYIENKLGNWIWNGVSLSLAAQIATLPISLYYFHQFPVFFWLSGIVVAAAASMILSLGIALLCFHTVPLLGTALGYALHALLFLMNSLIFLTQQLPGAVWEGFWLESWQMWTWYLVLISGIHLLLTRQLKWAFVPLSLGIILFAYQATIEYQHVNQSQLCIYNSRKSTLISYINGSNCTTWMDATLLGNPQVQYAQQNHLWSLGVRQNEFHALEDSVQKSTFYYQNKKGQFKDQKLSLYGQEHLLVQSHTPLEVDYVLVHGNPKLKSIQQIEDLYLYKTLVFDASNSPWKIKKWVKECQELNIDFFDVSTKGALVLDL
ncbi:MAG: Competence protein [uncultured Aureispira sp.]|uniref:Competence protein n=1 Tax=uncultured Aureispira sp. TaxID=1331704 RepID=A0A6S6UBN8_9BACT|nr:MAG: Competence protein [uncultured Aureispira sp.]